MFLSKRKKYKNVTNSHHIFSIKHQLLTKNFLEIETLDILFWNKYVCQEKPGWVYAFHLYIIKTGV